MLPGTVAPVAAQGSNPTYALSLSPATLTERADSTSITVTATKTAGTAPTTDTAVTLSLAGTATKGTDYADTTPPTLTISANADTATATLTIDPTLDILHTEGDETIIVSGTATGVTLTAATLTLQDGPYLAFSSVMTTQVEYDQTTVSTINLPTASNNVGTVTYTVTSDPATPSHGLTHNNATLPGTLTGTTAAVDLTGTTDYIHTRYTITATDNMNTSGDTSDDKTVTTSFSLSVVKDQCGTPTSWYPKSPQVITPTAALTKDCNILLAAKDTLNGSSTTLNWSTSLPMASQDSGDTPWKGTGATSATANGVGSIILQYVHLSGSIPPVLGGLARLSWLNLNRNNTGGGLDLTRGDLSGAIPKELASLTDLTILQLSENKLSGAIPPELGQLTNLGTLDLSRNDLTGSIPPELGQLTKLTDLVMHNNALTGSIPTELSQLTKLTRLDLGNNALTGSIPPELGQLTELTLLGLSYNALTGSIPTELGQLTKLTLLVLRNNALTGSIPTELSQLTRLTWLDLGGNGLTGSIPEELGTLPKLQGRLRLTGNPLGGSIPSTWGSTSHPLSDLEILYLTRTELTGTLPVNLSKLSKLQYLYLSSNHLTGPIPTDYKDLTALTRIRIFYNESVCLPEKPVQTDPNYADINALHTWYNGIGNREWVAVHCAYDAPTSAPTLTPGGRALTLSWSAYTATDFTTSHYEVSYRPGKTGPWLLPSWSDRVVTATSFTLSSLTPGQSYQVRYRALDDIENTTRYVGTKWSPHVEATPLAVTLGVSVTAPDATLTITNWTNAWWYQKTEPTGDDTCTEVTANTTTADLTGLTANTLYLYTAYSKEGCNSADQLAATRPFTAPEVTLAAINIGTTSATLSIADWTNDWWHKRTAPTETACIKVDANTTTAALSGLTAGTTYTYTIHSDAECASDTQLATKTFRTSSGGGGSGGGGGGGLSEPAPLQNWLESPANEATVSGVDVIRGWSFAEARGVRIAQVDLYLDGRRVAVIPCCSARPDVAQARPDFPVANTGQSGWGITTNWGNLTPGRHTLRVRVTSTDEGRWFSEPHAITVLKPGDIPFADRFSLAEATARLDGNHLVMDGVVLRDKATQEETEVAVRYGWQTGAQGLRLIASRTIETAQGSSPSLRRWLAGLLEWGRGVAASG